MLPRTLYGFVPVLLCLLAAVPVRAAQATSGGVVLGPASQGGTLPGNGRSALPARPGPSGCQYYFDASRYFGGPSASSFTLLPQEIVSADSQSHGGVDLTASANAGSLVADAAIAPAGGVRPQVLRTVTGYTYFVSSTSCTASSFALTLQSSPTGAAGTVLATMGGGQRLSAGYTASFNDIGLYLCSLNGHGLGHVVLCEAWQVNVDFDFQTASFAGNGAGTYQLDITQSSVAVQ